MIRILLAEDQGMVRGALAALLALEPDLEIVAQLSSGDEVLAAAEERHPDVALLDIEMPGMNGIEAAARLRRELPECKILILTTFGRPAYLRRAMEAGASGFLVKDAPAERLANAIRRAATRERIVDPELAAAALQDGESPLTPREREVLETGAGIPRCPRSRGACISRKARCATTSPRRSARPAPATGPRPGAARAIAAGCSGPGHGDARLRARSNRGGWRIG
jgi:two-component system response regulator DesR